MACICAIVQGSVVLGGRDAADLRERCQAASDILQWPLPYADIALHLGAHETSTMGDHANTLTASSASWKLST